MEFFEPTLPDLQDRLPSWWSQDPVSELGLHLGVFAALTDELAARAEAVYRNTRLATASDEAVREEWAYVYGVQNEQLPSTVEQLRAFISARAAEDGSLPSLITTLLTLIATPINLVGTVLLFDAGGAGLTFPVSGTGIGPLFQNPPPARPNLFFPIDGSGIAFPRGGDDFPADGTGLIFAFDGTGIPFPPVVDLTFGIGSLVDVDENISGRFFTVSTRSYLAFDRGAVKRTIGRYRPVHLLAPVYVETNTP